jgi:hypothetical protein
MQVFAHFFAAENYEMLFAKSGCFPSLDPINLNGFSRPRAAEQEQAIVLGK